MSVTNKEKNFISAVVYLHNDGAQAVRFFKALNAVLDQHFEQYELVAVDGIGGVDAVVDSPEFGLVELACRLYEAGYRRIVQVEQFIRNMAGKRFLNPGMHQIGRYMAEHYPDVVLDDTSLLFEVPRF